MGEVSWQASDSSLSKQLHAQAVVDVWIIENCDYSMTRFMQNLTPWSIYLEFINWQKFEPTLEKYAFGQTFTVVNGLILKNDLAIWSH